jgi:hypothetical protein
MNLRMYCLGWLLVALGVAVLVLLVAVGLGVGR